MKSYHGILQHLLNNHNRPFVWVYLLKTLEKH